MARVSKVSLQDLGVILGMNQGILRNSNVFRAVFVESGWQKVEGLVKSQPVSETPHFRQEDKH